MKHVTILTFVFVLLAGSLSAQSYITAVGARFGGGVGLTVQQRITKKTTVEGILQSDFTGNHARITGLYQRHFGIITRNLNIYGGAGLYKEWNEDNYLEEITDPMGLAFVVGGELSIGRVNVSLDLQPSIQLTNNTGGVNFNTHMGVSARYILIKDKGLFEGKKKKKKKKKKDGFDWDIFDRN